MKKFTQFIKTCFFLTLVLVFFISSAFFLIDPLEDDADFVQNMLGKHYDEQFTSSQLQSYELSITNNGFCRYKRHYKNGKIEYFAFNFIKFRDADFIGGSTRGRLCLRTDEDDVIVQTYKDRNGDIDSMASSLTIPLKQVEPEDLNILVEKIRLMRVALRKQQTRVSPGASMQQ